jgi:hypothetical protein
MAYVQGMAACMWGCSLEEVCHAIGRQSHCAASAPTKECSVSEWPFFLTNFSVIYRVPNEDARVQAILDKFLLSAAASRTAAHHSASSCLCSLDVLLPTAIYMHARGHTNAVVSASWYATHKRGTCSSGFQGITSSSATYIYADARWPMGTMNKNNCNKRLAS